MAKEQKTCETYGSFIRIGKNRYPVESLQEYSVREDRVGAAGILSYATYNRECDNAVKAHSITFDSVDEAEEAAEQLDEIFADLNNTNRF